MTNNPILTTLLSIIISAFIIGTISTALGIKTLGVALWLLHSWFMILNLAEQLNKKTPRQ